MTEVEESAVLDDEAIVTVGRALPRLLSVVPLDGLKIRADWDPATSARPSDIVDLSPLIERYRVYAPLRQDPELFRTVKLQGHRYGIAWGRDGEIDMAASTIADLVSGTDADGLREV